MYRKILVALKLNRIEREKTNFENEINTKLPSLRTKMCMCESILSHVSYIWPNVSIRSENKINLEFKPKQNGTIHIDTYVQ